MLRRLADGEDREGLVISTLCQTAGRGRRGRPWVSPQGNLAVSFLLRGGQDRARAAEISFVAALALHQAIESLVPDVSSQLKWPNDVLVNGHKVAGILLEAHGSWVVLGIGVNIAVVPESDAATYPIGALIQWSTTITVDMLLIALAHALHHWHGVWLSHGFKAVQSRWLAHALGIGEAVVARLATGQEIRGRFDSLEDDGALLLTDLSGTRQRILAADVYFPPSTQDAGHAAGH